MKHHVIAAAAAVLCALAPYSGAQGWEAMPASIYDIGNSVPAVPAPVAGPPERLPSMICVDPGHPNTFNSGLAPVNGTTETHINWVVALKLEKILKEKGYQVLMTREAELQYVENKVRALMCNSGGAVLTVHLHCESYPGTGFALYYPDRQGIQDYKDDPDNGFKGPSSEVIVASKVLAQTVAKGMRERLAGVLAARGVYGDSRTQVGSNQGALTYSIFSKIPTLTIEMAVLTNKKDAAFMKSEQGQEKMAQAIAGGIQLYRAP